MKGYWIFLIMFLGIILFSISAYAQSSPIPDWIKNTAGWWSEGVIGDSDYINSLQWLIKEGILVIPQSNVVSESTSKVTTPPSIITEEYQLNLEAFYVPDNQKDIWIIISITDSTGKFVSKKGEIRVILLDFDNNEIFEEKRYIVADNFQEFTNKISGETVNGFNYIIQSGKIKSYLSEQSFAQESLYSVGLGKMEISLVDGSGQFYENEILLPHLPIDEGFFDEDTGFIDNFQVNKVLDIGPFFITVKDVGRYIGEDYRIGNEFKEFFKVNLSAKFKYVEGVTYTLDEIYLTDENNVLYSSDRLSIDNFKNIFSSKSYEYEGGNGFVLFEEVPSDVSEIKFVLKITRVEGDVSDTHFEDEIEISLR